MRTMGSWPELSTTVTSPRCTRSTTSSMLVVRSAWEIEVMAVVYPPSINPQKAPQPQLLRPRPLRNPGRGEHRLRHLPPPPRRQGVPQRLPPLGEGAAHEGDKFW